MAQHSIYYQIPARCWDEALPIGNGRLGAMIFGRHDVERIELNEDTLWSGLPETCEAGSFFEDLQHARQLLNEGKRLDADRFISEKMLHFDSAGYLSAGSAILEFHSPGKNTYRRELDLQNALHTTTAGDERCEWFASYPHQVIVMRYRGTGFSFTLNSPLQHTVTLDGSNLRLDGRCPEYARYQEIRQGENGIRYVIHARILAPANSIQQREQSLVFTGGEAVLLLAIRTNFIDWKSMPEADNYVERAKADINRAALLPFDELIKAHIIDHHALYQRSELELPECEADKLPTDERLKAPTPALAALLYHFGRYLLIASSRPGSQPANLQGIWNPHILAPWGSNYTTNINLEMNYWPAEGANLSECAEPLFRFARECAESGARTARELYRASGWCLHHNSDLWRHTTLASGQARWGFWPMGGLWICRHIFEHYKYGLDAEFLREYYPVLRGAAEFLLDFLVRNEQGEWTTSPATSPENGFIDPVTREIVCVCGDGTAMDLELAQEALEHFLEAARILDIDEPLAEQAEEVLKSLRPLQTGSEGQLLEYDANYEESEITHRHLSHLYGVYPGELFTPERNPELYEASRISLLRRKDHSTGWAMGWRLALWARFCNPEKTKVMLKEFFTPIDPIQGTDYNMGGIYPNLFSAHPPFQIDANFGIAAGILEMLIQSHRETADGVMILELLPAVPDDWNRGKITGVRCRNGLTVSFAWMDGKIFDLKIESLQAKTIHLVTPGKTESLFLACSIS